MLAVRSQSSKMENSPVHTTLSVQWKWISSSPLRAVVWVLTKRNKFASSVMGDLTWIYLQADVLKPQDQVTY